MNEPEAFQLLTFASARDGRTVSASVAAIWADDLFDVTLGDALDAAREHYRQSDKWLMPSHVLQAVKRRRGNQSLTVLPGSNCGTGRHKLVPDGTCMLCTHREAS